MRDAPVTTAGYQGTPAPNQWFGGPALSPSAGSMVLRDAAGRVVDSLNYGLLVDPWASEGYQAASGAGESGCRVPAPGAGRGGFGGGFGGPAASAAGANNIKVASVADFAAGQSIMVDRGASLETAVIATVGTAGATTVGTATSVGATVIPVSSGFGFTAGQAIAVDSGANQETALVAATTSGGSATITVAALLKSAHAAGTQVSGSSITLTAALTKAHAGGAQFASDVPTPGAPNQYHRKVR